VDSNSQPQECVLRGRPAATASGGGGVSSVGYVIQTCRMNFGGSIRINPVGVAVVTFILIILIFFNSGGSNVAELKATVNLKQLLSVAISAAERGGEQVVAVRKKADLGETSKGKTKEGANDPKTDGDMQSHVAMFYGIRKAFPDITVISEEHGEAVVDLTNIPQADIHNKEVEQLIGASYEVPVDEVAVWIDPLDATQEYTENLQEYVTTMVCIAVGGKPTIGVIHKPFTKTTAWGWTGEDVVSKTVQDDFNTGKMRIREDVSKARIIVSRSHPGTVKEKLEDAMGAGINITNAGGAGYKSWEVIKGNQDVYVHTTLIKKWDICAPAAILKALQGQLTTLTGKEIDYSNADESKNEGGVIASIKHHSNYVEKLKKLTL